MKEKPGARSGASAKPKAKAQSSATGKDGPQTKPSQTKATTAPAKDVGHGLRERALELHRILRDGRVYRSPLSTEDFLARVERVVSEEAANVEAGRVDPSLALLAMPVSLLSALGEHVPTMSWDYEFGYEAFFESLGTLLGASGRQFAWGRPQAAGRGSAPRPASAREPYEYTLDGQTFRLRPADDAEVHPQDYARILKDLQDALRPNGLMLYDPVTGDQSGVLVLIPRAAEASLRTVLVAANDPRAAEFY
jgi:hypothetical protein